MDTDYHIVTLFTNFVSYFGFNINVKYERNYTKLSVLPDSPDLDSFE